jgi:hypothetical protein
MESGKQRGELRKHRGRQESEIWLGRTELSEKQHRTVQRHDSQPASQPTEDHGENRMAVTLVLMIARMDVRLQGENSMLLLSVARVKKQM